MSRASALALAALGLLSPTLAADLLCLKDGRILENVSLQVSEDSILVKFANGQAVVPRAMVLECVLAGDVGFVATTEEEKKNVAKGLVPFDGKWMRPEARDARLEILLEKQRAAAAELKESRLWRNRALEETKQFSFEYTVAPHIFEGYRERMEAYYDEFVRRWKIKKPREMGKLRVRFYVDPENFYQVTGVSKGVLAFFEPVENPPRLQFYYDRLDPLGTERDMFHEFGHYLQKLINVEFRYAHWPGEALAEYFSTASWDPVKKRLTSEHLVLEERLIEIHRDIEEGEWVRLEQLIRGGNGREYHDYTWGWSLVHFLMGRPETAKKFEKFYMELARGRGVARKAVSVLKNYRYEFVEGEERWALFQKEMGLKKDTDSHALEAEWHDYVKNELTVSSSRGLARAARMATRHGRAHRAKRLYREAIEAGGADSLTYHRYAELLNEMEDSEGALESWAKAVELDPLVSDYYIAWGEFLLKKAESKEEGKRLLRLAQEIEPDNLYLERNLERLLAK